MKFGVCQKKVHRTLLFSESIGFLVVVYLFFSSAQNDKKKTRARESLAKRIISNYANFNLLPNNF